MTEVEYVQAIRDAAQRYIEVIGDTEAHQEDGAQRIRHWEAIKTKLSAHTTVRLCEFWLGNRATDGGKGASAGEEASAATIEA